MSNQSRLGKSTMAISPRPLVLCGPSGSGKSTLMKKLMGEFEKSFGFSVSHTTRVCYLKPNDFILIDINILVATKECRCDHVKYFYI